MTNAGLIVYLMKRDCKDNNCDTCPYNAVCCILSWTGDETDEELVSKFNDEPIEYHGN